MESVPRGRRAEDDVASIQGWVDALSCGIVRGVMVALRESEAAPERWQPKGKQRRLSSAA